MANNILFEPDLLDKRPEQLALFKIAVMQTEAMMLFPNEKEKRKAVITILTNNLLTLFNETLGQSNSKFIKQLCEELKGRVLEVAGYKNEEMLRKALENQSLGNLKLLLQAGKDDKRHKELSICAYLVVALIRLDAFGKKPPNSYKKRQASIALAIHLILSYKNQDFPKDYKAIKKIWDNNKKIAHLCAARYIVGNANGWNDLYVENNFFKMVSAAALLRKALLGIINPHKSRGISKSLFSEEDFIVIPEHTPIIENIPFQDFTKDEWLTLDTYFAPAKNTKKL